MILEAWRVRGLDHMMFSRQLTDRTTIKAWREERPAVLILREDIDDMRAAYWLASLSLEGYVKQLPERKKKCDKEERDFSDEFDLLQSWLKRILGTRPAELRTPCWAQMASIQV